MWLFFDNNGAMKVKLEHGTPARQGQIGDFSVFAYFNSINLDEYSAATLSLVNPGGQTVSSQAIYGMRTNKMFVQQIGETDIHPFYNGQTYEGYLFNFDADYLTQSGLWTATITLYKIGAASVQGRFTFNVQPGIPNSEDVVVTSDEFNALRNQLVSKINKYEGYYMRVLDKLVYYRVGETIYPNTQFSIESFHTYLDSDLGDDYNADKDIVFVKDQHAFYEAQYVSDEELTPSGGHIYTIWDEWVFKSTLDQMELTQELDVDLFFTSNATEFKQIRFYTNGNISYVKKSDGSVVSVYASGSWTNSAYKTISCREKQLVPGVFYNWLLYKVDDLYVNIVEEGENEDLQQTKYFEYTFICDLDNLQEKLESGVNIKTINDQSLLGEGNLVIAGAGTVTSVSAGTGLKITGNPNTTPTINVDDGYLLPNETQWNSKASQTEVVHKEGVETISGAKTFTGATQFTGTNTLSNLNVPSYRVKLGTTYSNVLSVDDDDEKLSIGNDADLELLLYGTKDRPEYNDNYVAMISDVTPKENSSNKVTSWSTTTTDTNYPSEKLTKDSLNTLQTEIDNLKSIGRFLSVLNASNGRLGNQPSGNVGDTYDYKVGDYYRIGASGNYTPKNTATFTIDSSYGSTNFELGEETYNIGDVIYCSSISGNTSSWAKQSSSGGGTVQDVQVDGTSVLSGGIANVVISGKANLNGGNDFTGTQVFNNASDSSHQNQSSLDHNGLKVINHLDDATTTYKVKQITNVDGFGVNATLTLPTTTGTLALTSDIPLTDVKLNGTSIVDNKVANIPLASNANYGVVKYVINRGMLLDNGLLTVVNAKTNYLEDRPAITQNGFGVISSSNYDLAVKHALCDADGTANPSYTDTEKQGARNKIGAGTGQTSIDFEDWTV